jgi:Lamin Tail Domain
MRNASWLQNRDPWIWICVACLCIHGARTAHAQLQFTEIMFSPGGADALWEWVEVRNTSASALNLDGWVFDDDDDSSMQAPNINAANGNTFVPAGGVAVLYPGDELDFAPQRFTGAWGGGITLIPLNGFTSLTATDSIGLWPSHGAYLSDAIPMVTTSPRRTFASAAAALDYSTDFPTARDGRSIAWTGFGSSGSAANWVESEIGELRAIESIQTTTSLTEINSTADTGNPGLLPPGPRSAGVLITEIMFDPRSPAVTSPDFAEADFEWVEIVNNTASAIDFTATPYVLDDFVGELDEPNITQGSLAIGEVGILFNSERITPADMQLMWGEGITFLPVDQWSQLNNGADTIAVWSSMADYNNEAIDAENHRGREFAVASVAYNTIAGEGYW